MSSLIKRVIEGETIQISETFLDDMDDPIQPLDDGNPPIVKLIDPTDKTVVVEVAAHPDSVTPGTWLCDLGVPDLNLEDEVEFSITWTFLDEDHATHKARDRLVVEPSSVNRVTDIVTLVEDVTSNIAFVLPFPYNEVTEDVAVSIYYNNVVALPSTPFTDPIITSRVGSKMTNVTMSLDLTVNRLAPFTLMVLRVNKATGKTENLTYTLWPITPQIAMATNLLESKINKAKLDNVIPELEYTMSDLVLYLFRGLQLFNKLPSRITDFRGTNMQGHLLDAWLICAEYYALATQLKAEGAVAFDFSGQSINLNVDRSPSEEAALGRVETQINDEVKEYKKNLCKNGYFTGDGSIGGKYMDGSSNAGVLRVSRSMVTKTSLSRRPFFRMGSR